VKDVVGMRNGGWNWLRILSVAGFDISDVEPSSNIIIVVISLFILRFRYVFLMTLTTISFF
jgi:hypothetical protein